MIEIDEQNMLGYYPKYVIYEGYRFKLPISYESILAELFIIEFLKESKQ